MNEEMERFERRLARQRLRKVPAAWRAEMLAAARAAQPADASRAAHRSLLTTLNAQLSTLLWPHPAAWAGLAAVWILILGVDFADRDHSPVMAGNSAPPSPEMLAELKQQQRMLVELMGSREAGEADRPQYAAPRPRTGRTEILTV